MRLEVFLRGEITPELLLRINEARAKEFGDPPLKSEEISESVFFVITEDDKFLATGRLHQIKPVIFNASEYSIMGIGGILVTVKGQGYGRKLMLAISDYLDETDQTGIGFCSPDVRGFYKKCGFGLDTLAADRFCFPRIMGQEKLKEGDNILYWEGKDRLMKKIFQSATQEVYFPCHPW